MKPTSQLNPRSLESPHSMMKTKPMIALAALSVSLTVMLAPFASAKEDTEDKKDKKDKKDKEEQEDKKEDKKPGDEPKTTTTGTTVTTVTTDPATGTTTTTTTTTDLAEPVATFSAFPIVVQTGTKPTLTWDITYPTTLEKVMKKTTPKIPMYADIRILGAGVTTQNREGQIEYIRTVGKMRHSGNSDWTTIFDGKNTDSIVQTQGIITTLEVAADHQIDFGGQYIYGDQGSFFSSLSGDNVRILRDGDACPSNIPEYNAPTLESFIKPYLDASKKVRIGPMDMIVFMELTHTNQNDSGYDVQDLVLLVTYREQTTP